MSICETDISKHVNKYHTNLKPLSCKHCGYKTTKKNDLEMHMNGVHLKLKHSKLKLKALKENHSSPHRKRKSINVEKSKFLSAKILDSFQKEIGFGDTLKKLLPVKDKKSSDIVAAFLVFLYERHTMWCKKRSGKTNLTSNPILKNHRFTNIFRELDKGTMFFRKNVNQHVIAKGITVNNTMNENLVSEVLFKSVVFRYHLNIK